VNAPPSLNPPKTQDQPIQMEFYDVINTRRSVRSYKPDEIPDDVLNRVLEAARVAPSGSNRQPWKYVLVKDPDMRRKIATISGGQPWIADAPIVVVACGNDINYDRGGYMGDMSFLIDAAIGLTHLILAARAEGLGTCWIGLFDNESIKELLDVPPSWNVVAVTPLGYPKEAMWGSPGKRKPLGEIVAVDEWC
jgi:nitroreductase